MEFTKYYEKSLKRWLEGVFLKKFDLSKGVEMGGGKYGIHEYQAALRRVINLLSITFCSSESIFLRIYILAIDFISIL